MAAANELAHPIKQRLQAGDVALGISVRLSRSGDIARIAKSTGHDFLFIDCQHSLFNLETIGHIVSTAMSCGTGPRETSGGLTGLQPWAAWSKK